MAKYGVSTIEEARQKEAEEAAWVRAANREAGGGR